MVDKGILRPLDSAIAVFKVPSALLVEVRVDIVLPVSQHHIVIIRLQRLAHKGLLDPVHEDLEGRTVKNRVMDIKEDVAGLLRLKDPAAEEAAANDLEGIDEGILYIFELELRQVLDLQVIKALGGVLLHQRAVLAPVVGGQEGRMGHDDLFHDLAGLIDIIEFLIELHHGEEVVHGGKRCVELIVHHVALLRRQGMSLGERLLIPFQRGLSTALGKLLFIEVCDLLRSPAQEELRGAQVWKVALRDQRDGRQGIAAELIEIIVDADLVKAQGNRKGITELFLQVCLRRDIAALEASGLRTGKGFTVQLAVGP